MKSKDLWIELTHKNMAYMRALVQKGEGQVPTRKKRASHKKKLRRMAPLADTPSPKKQRRETLSNETEFPNTQVDPSVHHFDVHE